uniref:Non-specific serine/threonine protein kinase n=1 Tax=Cyanothece sp. (strain PCC 7425 / ATCC 29141) TaxID=395961 RepID=B8HQI8_CYAP4
MAILHGIWLGLSPQGLARNTTSSPDPLAAAAPALFIWAETWRSSTPILQAEMLETVPTYPLAMTQVELLDFLETLSQKGQLNLPPSLRTGLNSSASTQASSGERTATPASSKTSTKKKKTVAESPSLPRVTTDWYAGEQQLYLPATPVGETLQVSYSTAWTADDVALYPWRVPGLCLQPAIAVAFLASLPLAAAPGLETGSDQFMGGDLLYWSHLNRWTADLLVRAKFLPGLVQVENHWQSTWPPLIDSAIDRARLKQFAQGMPTICRTTSARTAAQVAVDIPPEPIALIKAFLARVMGVQIKAAVDVAVDADWSAAALKAGVDPALIQWLHGLDNHHLPSDPEAIARLARALESWTGLLQQSLGEQNLWRTCFSLQPPVHEDRTWSLNYYLQSADEPEILIEADRIWNTPGEVLVYQGRRIERPQETLLMGLGLASRVYPPLDASLQSARPCQHHLNPTQVYEFLKAAAWRLEDSGFGVILPPSLSNQQGWANRLGLKIRAQTPDLKASLGLNSLLNFKWELSIGGQTLTKTQFDRLVALNTPLVEINGEWVELRPQDIKAAQSFFANRKNQTNLSLEDALRLSTGDTLTLEKLPVVSFEAAGPLQELLSTLTGNQNIASIDRPPGFRGELRPYQARGVGWLAFLERWGLGACLADDMGLGKTIQLIAFLLHLQAEQKLTGPTLLICPTSVLGNWEREVRRFAPQLKVLVHHGSGRSQGQKFSKIVEENNLIITSYALVYRDEATLSRLTWRNLVLDEAQNIKNPEARQSKTVRQLQAQFRIALTGTPLENRLTELWSILDFLNPGYLGPRNFFQRRFATPIERYGDTASLKTLRSLVQPFILRRLKTDREIIQDLPDKQEMTVFCGLTPEQAALYEATVQDSLAAISAAAGIQRRGLILATLTKLKQICNHPAQLLRQTSLQDLPHRSGKLKRLEEMLEEALAEGDRALIFSQFAEMGKLLQLYLREQLGWETLFLSGSTPKPQREAMVDRFQQDPQGPRIFILSLKAGGVGLNLTRANHVFHFDRWWNPAVENQATDRVFRIGQKRNVQVHKFVSTGTLEEKIHEQLESKKALAEQVVGAGENWLTELDTDQLRSLLLLDRTAVIEEEE